jgi:hypothetical protein
MCIWSDGIKPRSCTRCHIENGDASPVTCLRSRWSLEWGVITIPRNVSSVVTACKQSVWQTHVDTFPLLLFWDSVSAMILVASLAKSEVKHQYKCSHLNSGSFFICIQILNVPGFSGQYDYNHTLPKNHFHTMIIVWKFWVQTSLPSFFGCFIMTSCTLGMWIIALVWNISTRYRIFNDICYLS